MEPTIFNGQWRKGNGKLVQAIASMIWSIFIIALVPAAIGLVKLFENQARTVGLMDVPNMRSSHLTVTPRGGGVVVVAVWSVATLLMFMIQGFDFQIVLAL